MAGQTNRTITLTLNAQTNGADSVRDLAAEIQKLGKKGGDAAPEFERLAKELNDLAQSQDAVATFEALTAAVAQSKSALDAAKVATEAQHTALKELKQRLDAAKLAEDAHAVQVREATQRRQEANQAYREAQAAVGAYVAKIGGAKSANAEEKVSLAALNQTVRDTKAAYLEAKPAVTALTPEFERLKTATADAATAVRQQESALRKTNSVVDEARTEYEKFTEALDQQEVVMSKLSLDTKNLVGEQNKLAQSMAKLQTEATALKTALAAPGQAALTSAQRIEQAFGVMGVKSTNAIRAEILKVNTALGALARDATVTGEDFDRAFAAGKARITGLEQELKKAEKATEGFGSGFGSAMQQFGPATLVFNGITAAINAVFAAGQKIPQVAAEFQSMERTLRILTGSTASARKEMQYIADVSNRVGIDIKSASDSYIKLTAATKDTNLEGVKTRRIFEAVAGAMGALGASSAEAENAMQAVSQMVSKGVVSMEEMRQQLGERLPGAFQITAEELGITTAELNDLISSGKLAATDMLPALAAGLERVYKTGEQNDTLRGKWNEFINSLKQSGDAIGQSGVLEQLLEWGRVAAGVVAHMTEGFLFTGRVIGKVAAGIRTGDLSGALRELATDAEKMNDRVTAIAGGAPKTQTAIAEMAKEAKAAGQKFVVLADGTKLATDSVLGANEGFIKFQVEMGKAKVAADTHETTMRKVAETTRAAGEMSITAANALGDESDKRLVATRVAENNTAALDNLVAAEQRVIDVLTAEAQVRAHLIADGSAASDAHKKELKDLTDNLVQRRAAVDGLANQANANRVLAESLRLQSETLRDNSTRVDELRLKNEQLAAALAVVRVEVDAGRLSQETLTIVEQDAAKAKLLYNDALKDQGEKIVALNQQKQSQLDLDRSGVQLALEQQKSIYEVAKARGDEYGAMQAQLQMKRLEIQLSELTAKAKRAEAQAALAKIEVDRQELIAKKLLTEAAAAELKARELSAGVKLKEAEIADELAKRMRQLADANMGAAESAGGAANGISNIGDAASRAAGQVDDLNNKLNKVSENSPQSASDNKGFNSGGRQADRAIDIEALMYKRGASVEEAKAAAKYYGELYAREAATTLTGNLGNSGNAAMLTNRAVNKSIDEALRLARVEMTTGNAVDLGASVEDITKRNLANTKGQLTQSGAAAAMKAAYNNAGNEAKRQQTVVKINLGGKTTAVNVASSADATALTNLFKALEQSAGTAL